MKSILAPGLLAILALSLAACADPYDPAQRAVGGGLIGALGGTGGSSPFGSRAGDTFTRVTIYIAVLWFFLIMLQVRFIQSEALTRGQEGTVAGAGTRE